MMGIDRLADRMREETERSAAMPKPCYGLLFSRAQADLQTLDKVDKPRAPQNVSETQHEMESRRGEYYDKVGP